MPTADELRQAAKLAHEHREIVRQIALVQHVTEFCVIPRFSRDAPDGEHRSEWPPVSHQAVVTTDEEDEFDRARTLFISQLNDDAAKLATALTDMGFPPDAET